ncbi:MAG: DUF5658 family protein [Actinomycetota bacterium]|nr:DUF5658 family protein [Actinomycetota bacterium]
MTSPQAKLQPPGPDVVIDLRDPQDPRVVDRGADAPAPPSQERRRGFRLLLALNGLNLLDAGFTFALTEAGIAREGNPLIGWMTLPGKIAFVGLLSFVLWRLRPRALIVPLVAYALVVCYTLAGALFFS